MERLDFQGYGGVHIAGSGFGSPDNPPVLLLPSHGQTREFWYGSAADHGDEANWPIEFGRETGKSGSVINRQTPSSVPPSFRAATAHVGKRATRKEGYCLHYSQTLERWKQR
jgi:hypothetical protein